MGRPPKKTSQIVRPVRRVRVKKLFLVYQLPGSDVLRTHSVTYSRLYTIMLTGFGMFLALIFFALLEAGRAAEYGYEGESERLSIEWAAEERSANQEIFRREMLVAVEEVDRLVENQKQIRLLLSTRDPSQPSDLDWMETSLTSLDELRRNPEDEDEVNEFGAGAFLLRRLTSHRELLASAGEFTGRYHDMFAALPHLWPLSKDKLKVNSPYGWRKQPFYRFRKKLKFHRGIDLDAERGDSVLAAAAGSVKRISRSGTGYGKLVHLNHADGYETLYAHLNRIHVRKGDHIRAGQVIGRAGSTGYSTGPHLHYEVRRYGKAVNPAEYLAL